MDQKRRQHDKEAASALTSIQHALHNNTSKTHDVIGIVVKISVDALNSKAQVLIADDSIPENAYARVSLFGNDAVTSSLVKVSVGDVLSFHGFQITRHDTTKLPLVADFQCSWQEPEAGWTRLYAHHGEAQVSCQDEDTTRSIQSLVQWFSKTKFNESIPSLPCRRRRLSELQAVGMTSHVVARVVSVDTAAAASTSASRNKRKRWLPLKKRRTTIAVLSDGDEIMPLLGCAAHEEALKEAIGNEVLLTHVVTCVAEEKSDENIVLRPTESTTVIPRLDNAMSTGKRVNQQETQCISMTQEMPGAATLARPLTDVYIDELGISLGDGKRFVSPNGFVSTLVDTSGSHPCYRAATLTLDGIVVKADAELMQTLCGSIDPVTLLNHSRLKTHVTDLMRGLLDEQVDLTWAIEQVNDVYYARKCFLPRL